MTAPTNTISPTYASEAPEGQLTVKQAARVMGVSVRSVHMAIELQRCRPDLAARCLVGEMTVRQALRIAKPEKYAKRDKLDQWLAQFRSWNATDRIRALSEIQKEAHK